MISCDGKPQQSFSFRFAELKTNDLCLFINDLYKTAQLREAPKEKSSAAAVLHVAPPTILWPRSNTTVTR